MAETSYGYAGNGVSVYPNPVPNPAGSLAVVSPQFCAPNPVDLIITRKLLTLSEGGFGVTDVNGNLMFRVKGKLFSLHDRRVLLDAAGNPVINFEQQVMTAHRRWKVYRAESTEDKDLLFSVKKSSWMQLKSKLDVYLASNVKQDVSDFKIEGSYFERTCTIYAGDSSTNVIAQMHRKHSVSSVMLGKDTFAVTVYPNVDHVFIVALVVILEEINEDRNKIV